MPQPIFPTTRSGAESIIIGLSPTMPLDTQALVDALNAQFGAAIETAFPLLEQETKDRFLDLLEDILPIIGSTGGYLDAIEEAAGSAYPGINCWAEDVVDAG